MIKPSAIRFALLSATWILLPGALRADLLYSFSGTYSPYQVSISFHTSLTGAALDNLSSDDITSTVSNFAETNTLPSSGSAALDLIISTDTKGNITAFKITDTAGRVLTNTSDTSPAILATYIAPSTDSVGNALMATNVQNGNELFGYYGYGIGYCVWNVNTGIPTAPGNTDPDCPTTPVLQSAGSPGVSAAGSGTWTPHDPGAPATVPEVGSVVMLATEFLFVLAAMAGFRKRLAFWAFKKNRKLLLDFPAM